MEKANQEREHVNATEAESNDGDGPREPVNDDDNIISLSFTPSDSDVHVDNNGSFSIEDLRSPSPRQASVSVSFSTTNSSCLDYSADDLSASPISPVSNEEDSPCSCDLRIISENLQGEGVEDERANVSEDVTTESMDKSTSSPGDSLVSVRPPTQTSECNEMNCAGQSPPSSSNRFLHSMKILIDRGADVNLKDRWGRTPLHLAVENVDSDIHHECVKYLLERGADAQIVDIQGRSALHIAAKTGCAVCLQLLLDHGVDTDVKQADGNTALLVCAMEALSPGVVAPPDDSSHSSVESTTPSLLFRNDATDDQEVFAGSSFYQSPREMYPDQSSFRRSRNEMSSHDNVPFRDALRVHNNDSGYFTASGSGRGRSWVKTYYSEDTRIDEERESSAGSSPSSSITDVDGKCEMESESDSLSRRAINFLEDDVVVSKLFFGGVELVLRLVLYLLHSLLTWSRSKRAEVAKDARPGDPSYCFTEPPGHVAEAMERLRRSRVDSGKQ